MLKVKEMTTLHLKKPTIRAPLSESKVIIGTFKSKRSPKEILIVEPIKYRRKIFNILREVESLVLNTPIYSPTKNQLVEDFQLIKCQADQALKEVIAHLTKICELDVKKRRSDMIKLVRLHKSQNQTRIQWNPRVKIKLEEIASLDNSNDPLTETINFSGQNDDIDLLNLLEQYGVSFPN